MDEEASQRQVNSVDVIGKLKKLLAESLGELKRHQKQDRATAQAFRDHGETPSGVAMLTSIIYSYDIDRLYIVATKLLDIVQLQANLNDELMNRVSGMETEHKDFKRELSRGLGEAVRDVLDNLDKQAKEKAPEHVYG